MTTRRSRHGQAPEFEADGEIERRFRDNLAVARQTIDDVLPAESEQKQEALDAVGEFEADVTATDGDEEALQEGTRSLDAFSASLLLADTTPPRIRQYNYWLPLVSYLFRTKLYQATPPSVHPPRICGNESF